MAEELVDLAAITLYIGFDKTKVSFRAVENVNNLLPGMISQVYSTGDVLIISWTEPGGVSFVNNKLFDIAFSQVSGTTSLTFNEGGCQLANKSFSIIPVTLKSGTVECKPYPSILAQPLNKSVVAGDDCSFTIVSDLTSGYSWKESRDNGISWTGLVNGGAYSGVNSQKLDICNTPLLNNGYLYFCSLDNSGCMTSSLPAKLSVSPVSVGTELGLESLIYIRCKPNPVTREFVLEYKIPESGLVSIKIFDITGKEISFTFNQRQAAGTYSFIYDGTLGTGIYFCLLNVTNDTDHYSRICKIIKQSSN